MMMHDSEKVLEDFEYAVRKSHGEGWDYVDGLTTEDGFKILQLLKKQKAQKFLVGDDGKITPLPVVVQCKDCIHRGKAEKCVLAISKEKDFPLFMLDNRGDWFCADGMKRDD